MGHKCKCNSRPSSFGMQDPGLVLSELKLKSGDAFLDIGCGAGDYSKQAAERVGDFGLVYALDISEEMVNILLEETNSQGFKNIRGVVADITDFLPIESQCVDVCLIATVLHTINLKNFGKILKEIHRVLKPSGRVIIIECKKEDMPFGPPKHMRLSPDEIENSMLLHGFTKIKLVDLGFNYMVSFTPL